MPMCRENLIDFSKYEVYENGNIFSKSYNKNRYLKGELTQSGYLRVLLLCTDGKRHRFQLHRVIWYYFNGEIPDELIVNHIDECKTNNALSNLNLLTPKQNLNWGSRNKRISKAHLKDAKPIAQIDKLTNKIIKIYPSRLEASKELHLNISHINECCNGKRKSHGGFIWSYQ